MSGRRLGLALATGLVALISTSASANELDAYRRFVRTPEARALLAAARNAMEHDDGAIGAAVDWPAAPVGLYVSLVKGRDTRACVGSPTPPRGSLSESVRSLAVLAMSADPRRPPVRREELPDLRVVISFAREGGGVATPFAVDPGREGLLIGTARGSVAFLPGEARTIQWALREARRAGVLAGDRDASYQRLEVVTLSDPSRSPIPRREEDDAP